MGVALCNITGHALDTLLIPARVNTDLALAGPAGVTGTLTGPSPALSLNE
jgi:hypothetical protein